MRVVRTLGLGRLVGGGVRIHEVPRVGRGWGRVIPLQGGKASGAEEDARLRLWEDVLGVRDVAHST